jgi:hypothetical protein
MKPSVRPEENTASHQPVRDPLINRGKLFKQTEPLLSVAQVADFETLHTVRITAFLDVAGHIVPVAVRQHYSCVV